MTSPEPRVWHPLWLDLCGLPRLVADKTKGAVAWAVFRTVVEIDCSLHTLPGTVEITLTDLEDRAGLARGSARKAISALRKHRLLACFLPDDDEEPALIKVQIPLPVPVERSEVIRRLTEAGFPPPASLRYLDPPTIEAEDSDDSHDRLLQEIVDLYFNTVGLKMNAFVLDELRLIRHRFPIEPIRRAFRRAQQNEIRSLQWVVRELVRVTRKNDKKGQNTT
ncbi:MAG: hypothetical protein N2111_05170 [Candidatus Sumerlaeaceae bacterium]|nr:hypothetical protein [Candidatus Sumerlaeaceae bacterium]